MKNYIEAISDFIFCEDRLKKTDVIIIPGNARHIIAEKSAELFNQGFAEKIVVSGKYSSKRTTFPFEQINDKYSSKLFNTEGEFLKYVLEQNGVSTIDIILENESRNTLENAEFIKQKLKDEGISINSAIVCCQAFHARRVQITYSLVFPDVDIYIYPVVTQDIHKNNWFLSKNGIDKVMNEVEKCGKYFTEIIVDNNIIIKEDF